MITRLTAAIVALLAFAGMILAGLAAGNPFHTILYRALIGLVAGLFVGHVAGVIARRIVHEHFADMINRDTASELAAEGEAASAEQPVPADETAAAATAAPAPSQNVATVAQEVPADSRKKERLTRERTLSARAAREMQKQL
jgi:hypothetical protein